MLNPRRLSIYVGSPESAGNQWGEYRVPGVYPKVTSPYREMLVAIGSLATV